MRIEQILELWQEDSKIDPTNIGEESLKFTKLHHKYYTIFKEEKLKYLKLQADLKVLKLDKFEFFTQGPNEETEKRGWKLPSIGRILRNDVPFYMDADKDLVELNLKIGVQLEKIELLKSIIDSLKTRGFAIKNHIEFLRFINGA